MGVIRALAVFRNASGLARDQVVNTFHFNADDNEAAAELITAQVKNFYNQAIPATGATVGRHLSSQLLGLTVKLYDVTVEPSGAPFAVSSESALPARLGGGIDLPEEVAICLSFEGTPEAGLIQTRRRGRIYLGPFNQSVFGGEAGVVQRPSPDVLATFRAAGARLATSVDALAEWVVYSRPYEGRGVIVREGRPNLPAIAARPGTTVNIDRVWTDNDWDTQRRRGMRATAKTFLTTGE